MNLLRSLLGVFLGGGLVVGGWVNLAVAGDGGELSLRLVVHNELAWLREPGVTYTPQAAAARVYVPRFGGQLAYGLAHWLEMNVAGMVSLNRTARWRAVHKQGIAGNLQALYGDFLLPVGLTLKWDRGTTYNVLLSVAAGPAWLHWHETAFQGLQDEGNYPVALDDVWYKVWFAQAQLLGQWRAADWFALAAGPSWLLTTTGDKHFGLHCSADFIFGFGPYF